MFFLFDFFFMGILFIGFILITLIASIPAVSRRLYRRKGRQQGHFQSPRYHNPDVIESEFVDDPEEDDES